MYRSRIYQEVIYGHFRDFMEVSGAFQALMRERGWAEGTVWTPTVGRGNLLVWEAEYPDLASFQREGDALYADKDVMDLVRQMGPHIVQGSAYSELWEQAPSSA